VTRGLAWRLATVIGSVLLALIFLVPNFAEELPSWWSSVFPDDSIRLGLDLQGGIHLVLEVDVDKAVANSTDLVADQLRSELRDEEIATRDWKRSGIDGLSFELVSRSKKDQLLKYVSDNFPNLERLSETGHRLSLRVIELEVKNIRQFAIDQAVETIRNRVDEFGVSEPTIQRTGASGILVQLPGVQGSRPCQASDRAHGTTGVPYACRRVVGRARRRGVSRRQGSIP